MMPIGIMACAFGQQGTYTAGPSNEAIGQVALEIKHATAGVIATQWEVQAHMTKIGEPADHVVSEYDTPSHYVTTQQVFARSLAYFKTVDVSKVVIVAQPLHLKAIRLVMKDWVANSGLSFTREYDYLMRRIPFDDSPGNVQDWTRGPLRFGAYLVRAKLFDKHGN